MVTKLRRAKARLLLQWHLFWFVRELRTWLRMVGHER
jgi:hypothetical protein